MIVTGPEVATEMDILVLVWALLGDQTVLVFEGQALIVDMPYPASYKNI